MESSYFYELYGKEKREQGREEGRMEIIRNLLKNGVSAEEVSKWTGVPINQVKSIKF